MIGRDLTPFHESEEPAATDRPEVELKLTHVPSAQVHVIAQRLEYSGEKLSNGPKKAFEKDLKASDLKEVKFSLPDMGDADAYVVKITL